VHGLSYNRFIEGLRKAGVDIDRKVLADLAVRDGSTFGRLVETAKAALATQ
jgi:large subunit ribosomal protein L20